jgi:hypothetical protein
LEDYEKEYDSGVLRMTVKSPLRIIPVSNCWSALVKKASCWQIF